MKIIHIIIELVKLPFLIIWKFISWCFSTIYHSWWIIILLFYILWFLFRYTGIINRPWVIIGIFIIYFIASIITTAYLDTSSRNNIVFKDERIYEVSKRLFPWTLAVLFIPIIACSIFHIKFYKEEKLTENTVELWITYDAILKHNDNVGNEWAACSFCNGVEIPPEGVKLTYVCGDKMTFKSYAWEEDESHPDIGTEESEISFDKTELSSGGRFAHNVFVEENNGRYTGNVAKIEFIHHLKRINKTKTEDSAITNRQIVVSDSLWNTYGHLFESREVMQEHHDSIQQILDKIGDDCIKRLLNSPPNR